MDKKYWALAGSSSDDPLKLYGFAFNRKRMPIVIVDKKTVIRHCGIKQRAA
jgi:hypothetical protein